MECQHHHHHRSPCPDSLSSIDNTTHTPAPSPPPWAQSPSTTNCCNSDTNHRSSCCLCLISFERIYTISCPMPYIFPSVHGSLQLYDHCISTCASDSAQSKCQTQTFLGETIAATSICLHAKETRHHKRANTTEKEQTGLVKKQTGTQSNPIHQHLSAVYLPSHSGKMVTANRW